jgi:peptidoglycan-N-acetylglucosamine deacetylase
MLKILTSWDDGSKYDIRLAALLRKYNLPAVFFIPTCHELSEYDLHHLASKFELGGHTTTHPEDLKLLTRSEQYDDIKANKDYLEQYTKYNLRWFAYPSGRGNKDTEDAVREAGFIYGRGTEVNYWGNINKLDFKIHTSLFLSKEKNYLSDYFVWFMDRLGGHIMNEGVLHIWGHSADFERDNMWDEVEDLFRFISNLKLEHYDTISYTKK